MNTQHLSEMHIYNFNEYLILIYKRYSQEFISSYAHHLGPILIDNYAKVLIIIWENYDNNYLNNLET